MHDTVTFGELKPGDVFRFPWDVRKEEVVLKKKNSIRTNPFIVKGDGTVKYIGFYERPDGAVSHCYDESTVEVPPMVEVLEWVLTKLTSDLVGKYVKCKNGTAIYQIVSAGSDIFYGIVNDRAYRMEEGRDVLVQTRVRRRDTKFS